MFFHSVCTGYAQLIIYISLTSWFLYYSFPEYEVISDKMNSKLAGQQQFRYTGPSLRSVIMDIHFLSMTDYLVCTFSSQVGSSSIYLFHYLEILHCLIQYL